MRIALYVLLAVALPGGCSRAPRGGEAGAAPPVAANRYVLRAIDLRYGIYLLRVEIHATITPEGHLRTVTTEGKSYGPNDKSVEHTRVREGQLTPKQMADLATCFADWESFSTSRYSGFVDGPEIGVRYGEKTVAGGSETPKPVFDAYERIMELTTTMPLVDR